MAIKAVSRLITGAADFEEGVWTPTLEGMTAAGVHTYSNQTGVYVKIGPVTFAWCQVFVTALGTGGNAGSGGAQIAGLPYSSRQTNPDDFLGFAASLGDVGFVNLETTSGEYSVRGRLFQGTRSIRLRHSGDNMATPNVDIADLADNSLFVASVIYRTN